MTSTGSGSVDADHRIDKAIEAGRQSDAALVATLLGCKRSLPTGLDEPLHPSTTMAARLLLTVTANATVNTGSSSDQNAWKTLMLIPPSYETPWRAALRIVEDATDASKLWTGLVEVQTFLQHTISIWWKQQRDMKLPTNHTPVRLALNIVPRQWILDLSDAVLKPLFESNTLKQRQSTNRHWLTSLDLIVTMVSLTRELEGDCIDEFKSSIVVTILDKVFSSNIRDDYLLPWIALAADLKTHLRRCDWNRLQIKLESSLTMVPCKVPLFDLPGIGRSIIMILPTCTETDALRNRWRHLLPKVLMVASKDIPTYSTVETILRSTFSSFATRDLQRWWMSIRSVDCEPWIAANIQLLFLHASQQSGSQLVSSILEQALGANGVEYIDIPSKCWECLVQLHLQDQQEEIDVEQGILEVKELLLDMYYQGEGSFNIPNGVSTEIVCKSIFMGRTQLQKRSLRLHAVERAQLWVNAANNVLKRLSKGEKGCTKGNILLAVLVVVTVFCEIPESRSAIVKTFVQHIGEGRASLHCIALKMMVQTFRYNASVFSMSTVQFISFADVFSGRLDDNVCYELAHALSPLSTIRPVMLSIARKLLYTPTIWWSTDLSHGMQETYDGIRCALHILCSMMDYTDAEGFEAGTLVSNIIVLSKPPLPLFVRSWFIQRLTWHVNERQYSTTTLDRLFRACLMRTLSFFDDRADGFVFVPSRIFVTWGMTTACSSQQECLPDLLLMILAILEQTNHKCCNKYFSEMFCDTLSELLAVQPSLLFVSSGGTYNERSHDWDKFKVSDSPSLMTLACILAIYRACVCISHGLMLPSSRFTIVTGEPKHVATWRSELVKEERAQCRHLDLLPQWTTLAHENGERRCKVGKEQIDFVLQSLCNFFLDFLVSPLWSSLAHTTEPHGVAKAFSFVVKIKRNFDNSQEESADSIWFDEGNAFQTLPKILTLIWPLFQNVIQDEKPMEEAECILNAILDCCSLLALKLNAPSGNVSHDALEALLNSILNLYEGVGSENNTIKMIAYLEGKCIMNGSNRRVDGFLRKIRTDDDIDCAIRLVRCSILKVLTRCLQRLRDTKAAKQWKEIGISLSVVRMLCDELSQGLRGRSGGITDMMYGMFLDCIEASSLILSRINSIHEMPNAARFVWSDDTNGAISLLFDVLCSFPVRSRSLFKRTLFLVVHTIPALAQAILKESDGLTTLLSTSHDFTGIVLRQCFSLLEKLNTSDSTVSWASIAGFDHVSLDVDQSIDESDDNKGKSLVQDVPSVVSVCLRTTGDVPGESFQNILQIPTTKHLFWALDSVIISMEFAWEGALTFMRQTAQCPNQKLAFSTFTKFVSSGETMDIICALLKPINVRMLPRSTCLARVLPKATKVRMCSLLAKLFHTLQKACHLVGGYVEKGVHTKSLVIKAHFLLFTWFEAVSICNEDVLTMIRNWLNEEQENCAKNCGIQSEDPAAIRLPRIVLKADELEAASQKLDFLMRQQHAEVKNRIHELEDAWIKRTESSDGDKGKSFRQLVNSHVKRTAASGAAGAAAGLSIHDRVNAGAHVPRVEQLYRKTRKRKDRQIRSRNHIVDAWLHLDQELDDCDDDAFIDLEDFLED